jgi:octaprenyl-diphosphate synthase
MNVNDPDITEENYMRVIYSKTARLFEAAAQCSGILAAARRTRKSVAGLWPLSGHRFPAD